MHFPTQLMRATREKSLHCPPSSFQCEDLDGLKKMKQICSKQFGMGAGRTPTHTEQDHKAEASMSGKQWLVAV